MGDRYISDIECAYCYRLNKYILYADGWGERMRCEKCGKTSVLVFAWNVQSIKPKGKVEILE